MNSVGVDDARIAASGRTREEHVEIENALRTDPLGGSSVSLDFEAGDFRGWSTRRLAKPYSAVIQDKIARVGTKSCRFEIRPGDHISQGTRAELRDWYNAPFEQELWYGFSTYIPAEFRPPASVGVVLAQWHDQAELGDPSGKPPLAIRYRRGALHFTGAFAETASHDPDCRYEFHQVPEIAHDRWLDFVFQVRWSRTGDSGIAAFMDGQPLFQFKGPLGYRNQIKGPYFKFGVYTSDEIDSPLIVYHDNYSRADGFLAVDPSVRHLASDGS